MTVGTFDVNSYSCHPFPNPMTGDIVEVEDDASILVKYFLTMGLVLIFLLIVSMVAVVSFVKIVKWRREQYERDPYMLGEPVIVMQQY